MRQRVAADLAAADIPHERFLATPTLLNNVLWTVVVDQGDTLRTGRLSLLDEPFRLDVRDAPGDSASAPGLQVHPVRPELLDGLRDQRAVRVATWFSDGYYAVAPARGDTLEWVDLRFGSLPVEGAAPVFAFQLYPAAGGPSWGLRQKPVRRAELDVGAALAALWRRMLGEGEAPPG